MTGGFGWPELGIGVDARRALTGLSQYTHSAHNAGKATQKFESNTKNLSASLDDVGIHSRSTGRALGRFAGIVSAFLSTRQLMEYSDTWTLIRARIGVVTDTMEQNYAVQGRIFEIAQKTRNNLAATSVLYTRLALNADQLGRSHEDLLNVVEATNNALLISGATGVEAAQSIRQLAQALGSGRLQGDEFRTVMEAMPVVARAISDELGVTVGQLYKLSKEGKISVDVVIDALLNAQEELAEQAASMPWTIGQSLTYFTNTLTVVIGGLNQALSASDSLGGGIRDLADHLGRIVAIVGGLVTAWVTYRIALLGVVAAHKIMFAVQTVKAMWEMLRALQGMARAMAILNIAGKGVAGLLVAIGTAWVGFEAYRAIFANIEAEMNRILNTEADLTKILGERATQQDDLAAKTRNRIDDMIREANQALVLAGFQEEKQERLKLAYDAINKSVEARRTLSGQLLVDMEAAIQKEYELKVAALAVEQVLSAQVEAYEEQIKIIDRLGENLQKAWGDLIFDILNEGIESFRDFFDTIKQMFLRMISEMIAAKAMQQLTDHIVAALTGAVKKPEDIIADIATQAAAMAGAGVDAQEIAKRIITGRSKTAKDEIEALVIEGKKSLFAKLAPLIGAGLAGAGIGSSIGAMTTNRGTGTFGGALGGAAAGFAVGGPLGAAVGGLAGAIGGLISSNDRLREEQRLHREMLARNNQRLQEMRDAIEGQGIAQRLAQGRGEIQEFLDRYSGVREMGFVNVRPAANSFLGQLAKELGIEIKDWETLDQFKEAIELAIIQITQFGRNLQDITTRIDAYNRIFDVEVTPQQALQDAYTILSEMAPELMREMGLANLDLTSEVGREVMLQGLKDVYNLIASGQLTPELLGAFTDKNQLLDSILKVKDAFDELHKQLYDVVTDFPRAMDIIFYEQKFGRFGTSAPLPPDAPERYPGKNRGGYGMIQVDGDINITTHGGETGEQVLTKVERAALERKARGGALAWESRQF